MKNYENLKTMFHTQKQWVNWKLQETKDGKLTKVPYTPTRAHASSTDPETWSTLADVENDLWGDFNGIGFVFSENAKILGIDCDHILVDGQISDPLFQCIYELVDTYTEISPSGDGLHMFVEMEEHFPIVVNKKKFENGTAIEVYSEKRYFTYTGKLFGTPRPVRTLSKQKILEILTVAGLEQAKTIQPSSSTEKPLHGAPVSSQGTSNMDDSEVMRRMFSSKSGQAISSLWVGDISHYNNDTSAADLALCSYLAFWCAKDAEAMERLWLASVLGQRAKTTDRKDYRDRTIQTAINNCTETFKGSKVDSLQFTVNHEPSDGDEAPVVLISEAAQTLPDIAPFSTGFDVFDIAMAGGYRPGDLVIFTGNTGFGKTTFAQTTTYNISKSQIHSVWFSYEMILSEVWKKFKAMGVDDKFLAYTPFKMVSGSTDWISQKIIEAKKKFGVKAVFIDHLGFLAPGVKKYDAMMANNYSAFLGNISRQLKLLALEHDVTVYLIAHTRKSEDPTINDIGNSVAIAQEADSVFIVHREADKYGSEVLSPYTKVTLAKNRRTGITKKISCILVNGKLEISADDVRPQAKKAYPVLSHEVDHGPDDFDYI